jgi:hypothetical protein
LHYLFLWDKAIEKDGPADAHPDYDEAVVGSWKVWIYQHDAGRRGDPASFTDGNEIATVNLPVPKDWKAVYRGDPPALVGWQNK